MRAVLNILSLSLLYSASVAAHSAPDRLPEAKAAEDTLSKEAARMTIEVNVPEAHTIETELGFVENGGILFTRKSDVTIFGSIKTPNKIQMVKVNGRKAKFSPEGDRYRFRQRIHLEEEYNTITVTVSDVGQRVKDMAFTIYRKTN